jgi:enoyl-CoA hydratase/carnithine racemase
MEASLETVDVTFESDSGIGYVRMNRPDSLNALSSQLRTDIAEGLEWLDGQTDDGDGPSIRVVVLEGAGGNFCAGADINEFEDRQPGKQLAREHYDVIMEYPVPIIAKIEGYCLGGGFETAMSCDFRIAHEGSRLGVPEVDLGMIPGSGGIQFISQYANSAVAKEMAMTGKHISGNEAHEYGLVNQVHEDGTFEDAVEDLAGTIASKPPLAIQAVKESADLASDIIERRKHDRLQSSYLKTTHDHKEGVRAFNESDYEPEYIGE